MRRLTHHAGFDAIDRLVDLIFIETDFVQRCRQSTITRFWRLDENIVITRFIIRGGILGSGAGEAQSEYDND